MRADEVAVYFLSKVDEDAGDNLTNLKLQKLLYYAQGCHLAVFGTPLFEEPIAAWGLGPVVPAVYERMKQYGNCPIPLPEPGSLPELPTQVTELLDEVYDVYGQFSPAKLVAMTHGEPPWLNTPRRGVITHDALRDYFASRVNP